MHVTCARIYIDLPRFGTASFQYIIYCNSQHRNCENWFKQTRMRHLLQRVGPSCARGQMARATVLVRHVIYPCNLDSRRASLSAGIVLSLQLKCVQRYSW